jgi:hypothetical protein
MFERIELFVLDEAIFFMVVVLAGAVLLEL